MAEDKTTLECPFCHNILKAPKGRDPLKDHAEHCHMWPDTEEGVQEKLEALGAERVSELLENAMDEARTVLAEIVTEIVERMNSSVGGGNESKTAVVFCMYCETQIGIIPAIIDGPTDAIVVAIPMNALMGLTESLVQHVVKNHTLGPTPGLVAKHRTGEN